MSGPRPVDFLAEDAQGWEWDAEIDGQIKVKRVKVSGTAMASDLDMLPARDTAEAIRTQGRSAIQAYLDRGEEPPDQIEFHTGGQTSTR